MIKKLLIPAMLLTLTGCTATVVDKYHMPEFERDHEECFQSSRQGCLNGKNMRVKVPECWRLEIQDGMTSDHICVPKDIWEKTEIGHEWTDETYPI